MSITDYRKKRNFQKTSEPDGSKKRSKNSDEHIFVVQKHAASHLHYDFRLEMNGVLKSWAVPKGPSIDPQQKRLAVHVEDHPLSYAKFAGTIPKGQYGAGTVEIWDSGTWEAIGNPQQTYKQGKLDFILHGKKLTGQWHLVRLKADEKGKTPWLLIKSHDKAITRIKKLPSIKPQLATLVDKAPSGKNWLHEIKYDGYRLLAYLNSQSVKLMTRNAKNWTEQFPEIADSLAELNLESTIFDGELVAIDKNHQINFQQLQNYISHSESTNLVYFIFDLLFHQGKDLRKLPLIERKKQLAKVLINAADNLIYSDHIIGNGKVFWQEACQMDLEGIMSKKIDSTYESKRTKTWVKLKCTHEQEFIIIGYMRSQHQDREFASLLLGYYDEKDQLHYCGRVGTGFTQTTLQQLLKKMTRLQQSSALLKKAPTGINKKLIQWIEPKLIAKIKFTEWTDDGILRHPSFLGLVSKPKNHAENITNRDKIFFPEENVSKGDLADYYEQISSWILPHIINRPLMILRCPQGVDHKCFFQKHYQDELPKGLYTIDIQEKHTINPYLYIKDAAGLAALAQLAAIEIHPWGSSNKTIEKPDRIIFDLDPAPDVEWQKVITAAKQLREYLLQLNLQSFVKTSGKKGLHIVVPLIPQHKWDFITEFSRAIATKMVEDHPDQYIATMSKAKRHGKIFIDFYRNMRGATAAAPFSCRTTPTASVSLPIAWSDLNKIKSADSYDINTALTKLKKSKKDPWEDFFKLRQKI